MMENRTKIWQQMIKHYLSNARYDCNKYFYFIYSGGLLALLHKTDAYTRIKKATRARVQKAFFYSQNHPT